MAVKFWKEEGKLAKLPSEYLQNFYKLQDATLPLLQVFTWKAQRLDQKTMLLVILVHLCYMCDSLS